MQLIITGSSACVGAVIGGLISWFSTKMQINATARLEDSARMRREGRARAIFLAKVHQIHDALQPSEFDGEVLLTGSKDLVRYVRGLYKLTDDIELLQDLDESAIAAVQELLHHAAEAVRFAQRCSDEFFPTASEATKKRWVSKAYGHSSKFAATAIMALGGTPRVPTTFSTTSLGDDDPL